MKKLILLVATIFIAICVSANNTKFVSPLTKENIESALAFLILSGLFVVAKYNFFYKLPFQTYTKTVCLRSRNIFRLFTKVLPVLILVPISISIFGFFWENRKTTLDHKKVASNTKGNVNVILIVIDALRADHLGCYSYERQTSPHIDALAKEGVLFKNCYAQASWTKPSTASLFTSLYPDIHGATSHGSALPDEVTTLAEMLKREGYITYSYVANPNLKVIFNFDQGFDFFDDYLMRDKLYYAVLRDFRNNLPFFNKITEKKFVFSDRDNIRLANKRIIPWLEKYKDENFFMYLHYMDPHDPYWPPKPYRKMYSYTKGDKNSENISLYDGEIRFVDEHINRLFEKLKSLGIYDKTSIIITSDHGEAFGEHNDEIHGHTIYQELLRVPLIIKLASFIPKGGIIEKQVRSIDIMPSILDILNIPCDIYLEGSSLLPLLKGKEDKDSREYVYIDNNYDEIYVLKGIIRDNEWKYIFTEKSPLRNVKKVGHEELYNLIDDPNELNNLIKQESKILRVMQNKLDLYKRYCEKKAIQPSQVEIDPETIRNLKSLGYLK